MLQALTLSPPSRNLDAALQPTGRDTTSKGLQLRASAPMTKGYGLNVVFETILKVRQTPHIFVVKTSSAGDIINYPSHFRRNCGILATGVAAPRKLQLRLYPLFLGSSWKKCASLQFRSQPHNMDGTESVNLDVVCMMSPNLQSTLHATTLTLTWKEKPRKQP